MKRISLSFYWSPALGSLIKERSTDPYPIEVHYNSDDFAALEAAINQGIDSHLEGLFFTEGDGEHGRIRLVFEARCLHTLVRRLMESEDDNAQSLASSICETLEIELI